MNKVSAFHYGKKIYQTKLTQALRQTKGAVTNSYNHRVLLLHYLSFESTLLPQFVSLIFGMYSRTGE